MPPSSAPPYALFAGTMHSALSFTVPEGAATAAGTTRQKPPRLDPFKMINLFIDEQANTWPFMLA